MIKQISKIALIAAVGFSATAAMAEMNEGYLSDTRGDPVKSGAGLCWKTGRWTPAMAIAECDPDLIKKKEAPPAPKAEAPKAPPPPPPPAPPPKPAAQKVTLAADTLFDFDKSALRAEGRSALDQLLGKIKGIKLEVIIAVGHADRFGSDKYNQVLSEKRAASVKEYLVSKGLEPNRVYTEGKGKRQAITKADQCKGAKSKAVVACLQPDRRVEIEVIGTK